MASFVKSTAYKQIAKTIIDLKNADQALRQKLILEGELGSGYNIKMAQLHHENADILEQVIDRIGYPTIEKVGAQASEAAWLVIQHSIGKPDFMRKCAALLKEAVEQGKAEMRDLAYLTDRIAVLENKPQIYGTQFDWDENGILNPNKLDAYEMVNRRRTSVGLNTIEEQTLLMRLQVQNENQKPPKDIKARKKEMIHWQKMVGWLE
jgi:hypothetical protein